jgi:hypothetical protein
MTGFDVGTGWTRTALQVLGGRLKAKYPQDLTWVSAYTDEFECSEEARVRFLPTA